MLTRATKLGNSFSQRCEFIFYFGFSYQQTGRQPLGLTDNVSVPIRRTAQINIAGGSSRIREVSTPAINPKLTAPLRVLRLEPQSFTLKRALHLLHIITLWPLAFPHVRVIMQGSTIPLAAVPLHNATAKAIDRHACEGWIRPVAWDDVALSTHQTAG